MAVRPASRASPSATRAARPPPAARPSRAPEGPTRSPVSRPARTRSTTRCPTNFVNTGHQADHAASSSRPGGSSTGRDFFAQQRNASISGTVWNDLDGDGSVRRRASPACPASPSATRAARPPPAARPHQRRWHLLDHGSPGRHLHVDYTVPANFVEHRAPSRSRGIVLAAGGTSTGRDFFAQQRNASISGTVWNDLNGNGASTAVRSASPASPSTLSGTSSGSTTTNGSGAYTLHRASPPAPTASTTRCPRTS